MHYVSYVHTSHVVTPLARCVRDTRLNKPELRVGQDYEWYALGDTLGERRMSEESGIDVPESVSLNSES